MDLRGGSVKLGYIKRSDGIYTRRGWPTLHQHQDGKWTCGDVCKAWYQDPLDALAAYIGDEIDRCEDRIEVARLALDTAEDQMAEVREAQRGVA